MTMTRRTAVTLTAVAGLLLALLAWAGQHSPANASSTFSKGGHTITLSVTCPTNGTTATKISSTGGNPGYAPRARGKSGTWFQGTEVSSGKSTLSLQATQVPVIGHGVRIFWPASVGGAENYQFC